MPPLPALWPLLTELAVATLAAVTMLAWGRRRGGGRPIPPTCARCRYDVWQRPPGVERCSECGADLTRPRAVRTRASAWRLGIVLPAAIVLVNAGLFGVDRAASYPWRAWFAAHGRLAWVEALARRDHSAHGDVYRNAWKSRDPSGPFYDHLLDLQADPAASWQAGGWDGSLDIAFEFGKLTRRQTDRLARQLFRPITVQVRSPVWADEALVVHVVQPRLRPSIWIENDFPYQLITAARVDGPAEPFTGDMDPIGTLDSEWQAVFDPSQWCPGGVSPGHHWIAVSVGRHLLVWNTWKTPAADPVVRSATVDVDVLPVATRPAVARPDPSRGNDIAHAVGLRAYRAGRHNGLVVRVGLIPLNVDRSFTVSAVFADGHRRRLGQIAVVAGRAAEKFLSDVDLADARRLGPTVNLELTGDGASPDRTATQQVYWPGRITFPNVPVGDAIALNLESYSRLVPTTQPFHVDPGR